MRLYKSCQLFCSCPHSIRDISLTLPLKASDQQLPPTMPPSTDSMLMLAHKTDTVLHNMNSHLLTFYLVNRLLLIRRKILSRSCVANESRCLSLSLNQLRMPDGCCRGMSKGEHHSLKLELVPGVQLINQINQCT